MGSPYVLPPPPDEPSQGDSELPSVRNGDSRAGALVQQVRRNGAGSVPSETAVAAGADDDRRGAFALCDIGQHFGGGAGFHHQIDWHVTDSTKLGADVVGVTVPAFGQH